MENVFLSILIAVFLAVGLSIVVLLPAYIGMPSCFCISCHHPLDEVLDSGGISAMLSCRSWLEFAEAWKAEKKESERANADVKTARKFTVEEVAKHNAESDCWLIVKNKVYDVSPYVNDHPGGEAILNNAGGENTKGFYGPQHPRWAHERIEEYYIGDIVQ